MLWAAVLGITILTGCAKPGSDSEPASVEAVESGQTYRVRGVVRSITPERDYIVIKHDEIEGFMDAMTMPFSVADTSVIRNVAPGDSITFDLSVTRSGAFIESLVYER